jgi:hypothetical protein
MTCTRNEYPLICLELPTIGAVNAELLQVLPAQTGTGNYTEGAGIRIVGTEIRLSIGTLPPSQ